MLFALMIIFGVAVQQHMSWQGFAVEAWLLRAKVALNLASVEDFGRLGRICNTVHRPECSIYAYGEIVRQESRNTIALGNLAMAQTEARRYQDALHTYDVFFKLGGSALDVLYWYARTLKEVGRASDAIPWYYRTLQASPNLLDATSELVELLIEANRHDEAMGLIASFIDRLPAYRSYWAATLATIDGVLERRRQTGRGGETFRVPKIGPHHSIPIRVKSNGAWETALVDTGASFLTIDARLVREAGLDRDATIETVTVSTANGVLEVPKVVLPDLWVGPVRLRRIEAVVCDSCGILLGQSVLSRFDIATLREDDTEFLILRLR